MLLKKTFSVFLQLCMITQTCMARDVLPQIELYTPDYSRAYNNVSSVYQFIKRFSSLYATYVRLDDRQTSLKGHPLYLMRLTNFSVPEARKIKVLFSYGEHPREFFPVESMRFFLLDVMNSLSGFGMAKKKIVFMLNNVDLFVLPLVNPDGRLYIEKTFNYCWRGTSRGVDLNRNFDWEFGGPGSSDSQTDEEYRGLYPFSEPEARFLADVANRFTFDVFVSFHSGVRQIFIPFSDSKSKMSARHHYNEASELSLASLIAAAAGHHFKFNVAHVLNDYPADGTSFDYMAGVKQIPFSLAIEMWGEGDGNGVKCFDLFNPSGSDLAEALLTINPIYNVIFQQVVEWKTMRYQHSHTLSYHSEKKEDELRSNVMWTLQFLCFLLLLLFAAAYFRRQRQPCRTLINLGRKQRIVRLKNLSDTLCIT
ncbi:carboxypeptidase O-like isoform X2 [Corticium candelabrum]|uniref:carboxypeptidase O-like isoform X2 n=1 Tax=Corticium candelabrum TaxID=121492 RepID=UPI002E260487|nr:carboxypeptidase O-like isoform X2 [Corticium candelabrum]